MMRSQKGGDLVHTETGVDGRAKWCGGAVEFDHSEAAGRFEQAADFCDEGFLVWNFVQDCGNQREIDRMIRGRQQLIHDQAQLDIAQTCCNRLGFDRFQHSRIDVEGIYGLRTHLCSCQGEQSAASANIAQHIRTAKVQPFQCSGGVQFTHAFRSLQLFRRMLVHRMMLMIIGCIHGGFPHVRQ